MGVEAVGKRLLRKVAIRAGSVLRRGAFQSTSHAGTHVRGRVPEATFAFDKIQIYRNGC